MLGDTNSTGYRIDLTINAGLAVGYLLPSDSEGFNQFTPQQIIVFF
jgi:hypothetical protein